MPAMHDVPAVVRSIVKQSQGVDTDIINRFFWQYTGTAPTDAQLSTFAQSIFTAWQADILTHQDQHLSLVEVLCEDLTSPTAAIGNSTSAPQVGSITTEGVALGTAVVISHHVQRRYRGGHPRTYLGGQAATNLGSDGQWGGAYLSTVATQFLTFRTAVEAAGWTGAGTINPVNISFFEGFTPHTYPSGRTRDIPTPRATPLIDQLVGFTVNPRVGTQRRRNEARS